MKPFKSVLWTLPLIAAASMLAVPGCNQSTPVTAPENEVFSVAGKGCSDCIQTCALEAQARMLEEKKRFSKALALCQGNDKAILSERALHKTVRAEIRRDLIDCRRSCRNN